jgi:D-alanine-D-alanine ligase
MGGRSAEREISLQSGTAVLAALRRLGHDAVGIDVDLTVCQQLKTLKAEVAFIALHGRYGEDGCIQGMLETLGIPYTGAGVLASALAMDKIVSKRLFDSAGIPTPPWCLATLADHRQALALGLPLVLKPRCEGSSVGLKIVRDQADLGVALAERAGPQLVERYIAGQEISVAVFGQGEAAQCLGTVEIRPVEGIYDYAAKYQRNDTQYLVPAPLDATVLSRLEALALAAHRLLECCGATRADFRYSGSGDPMLLELNTLPGLTDHSLLPKIAAHAGIGYDQLVERIARSAAVRA